MLKAQHAVIAAAVVAAWSGAPAFGQSTANPAARAPATVEADAKVNDKPEERASAVVRVIDAPAATTQAAPVTTAELVRARAAGEMKAPERSEPIQVERIVIDDPVRPATRSPASAQIQSGGNGQPQIVRAGTDTKDRAKTQPVVRLDDAARYRETAKYEAEKKRRDSTKAAAAAEPAQPKTNATEAPVTVLGSAQGRAEIAWSAPERPAPPVVIVESPQEIQEIQRN